MLHEFLTRPNPIDMSFFKTLVCHSGCGCLVNKMLLSRNTFNHTIFLGYVLSSSNRPLINRVSEGLSFCKNIVKNIFSFDPANSCVYSGNQVIRLNVGKMRHFRAYLELKGSKIKSFIKLVSALANSKSNSNSAGNPLFTLDIIQRRLQQKIRTLIFTGELIRIKRRDLNIASDDSKFKSLKTKPDMGRIVIVSIQEEPFSVRIFFNRKRAAQVFNR